MFLLAVKSVSDTVRYQRSKKPQWAQRKVIVQVPHLSSPQREEGLGGGLNDYNFLVLSGLCPLRSLRSLRFKNRFGISVSV